MRHSFWVRFILVLCLLLCAGIFVHGWQGQTNPIKTPPAYPKEDFSKDTSYPVVRVIDGDTVVLRMNKKKVTVRLVGIDTPETVHPTKKVEYFGKEASRYTKNLLKEGESVWVRYDRPKATKDKYGRLLAYLYRVPDGLFVNLEIVRSGHGHAYVKYPFGKMELFRAYEKRAREAGRGLWGSRPKGNAAVPKTPKGKPGKIVVYVTRTGRKYHTAGCRYLRRSKIAISLETACRGYRPCSICRSPLVPGKH